MRKKKLKAFTLIEIMVATAIMVVLVGIVIKITGDVLNVWNRAGGKLAANAEARIALDLLTQDIETAILRNNGQQWFRVDAPLDTEAGDSLYTNQTVSLKLFSPALDRPTTNSAGAAVSGDVCAIGYRLAYKESYTGGTNVYALYRRITDPETTFNNMLGSPSDANSPQLDLSGALWEDFGADSLTDEENYLAANIVEFKVFVYEEDSSVNPPIARLANGDDTTMELDTNVTIDGANGFSYYAFGGNDGSQDIPTAKMLYVDIILKVVSDEGLQKLQNLSNPDFATDGQTAESVVNEHGTSYVRRVYFPSSPI